MEPVIVDVVEASSTEVFRVIVAYSTRIGALRQTAGGPFRSPGGAVAVAAWTPQLHRPRSLRRPVGAHPCILVCAALPFCAPSRGRAASAGTGGAEGIAGPGYELCVQER